MPLQLTDNTVEVQYQPVRVFIHRDLRFQFRDRRPPARGGASSFGWLNTVNLVDLFAEFSHVY